MQWIYQMSHVHLVRGEKVVLDDVTLAFLPGAKVGVVGPNGVGKSTLLRVVAGQVCPSDGDTRPAAGISVGLLDQEPELDETRSVLGNVEDGVADTKAMLTRFTHLTELLAENASDELLVELGSLQEQLDRRDAWDIDSQLKQAMDALPAHPPMPTSPRSPAANGAESPCAGSCCTPGPLPAGRTGQPPGRRERAVVGAAYSPPIPARS